MPVLLLLTGPSAGRRVEVLSGVTLGRSPSCEVPLEDSQVSRRHARVWRVGAELRVADLGSRNGTRLNGEPVRGEAPLQPGDRVQVGGTALLVAPDDAATHAPGEAPEAVEGGPAGPQATGADEALLSTAEALLGAPGTSGTLRRAAAEARRLLGASRVVARLAPSARVPAACEPPGASAEVPAVLEGAALSGPGAYWGRRGLCVALRGPDGGPRGLLYAEHPEPGPELATRLAALGRLVAAALGRPAPAPALAPPAAPPVGAARAFRRALEQCEQAGASGRPVLLLGEPGTGRATLAAWSHARSPQAGLPLVEVDCRGLTGPLLEALLAPGEAGALLLREVEHLPPELAPRLAVLAGHPPRTAPGPGPSAAGPSPRPAASARAAPDGAPAPRAVRLLATGGPAFLPQAERLGPALAGVLADAERVPVPPLRERGADLPLLFARLVEDASPRGPPPVLTPAAQQRLAAYRWPHNVAELAALASRLALLYPGAEVPSFRLPPELLEEGPEAGGPFALAPRLERLEREAIVEALRAAAGKKIRAAALLAISRPTLDKKLAAFGLGAAPRARRPAGAPDGGAADEGAAQEGAGEEGAGEDGEEGALGGGGDLSGGA